jgi:hypothetical protein
MRLVLLVAALFAAPAWAKKPSGNPEAEARMREAEQLAKKKDHAGAIKAYRKAYAIDGKPLTLLAIATEQQEAGLEIDAIDTYQAYLKHPAADKVLSRKVQLVLYDLFSRMGTLRVELDQPADVAVDGKLVGEGMLVATTRAMAGEHTVLAQRPGFQDGTLKASVVGGEERVVHMALVPLTAPPSPAPPRQVDTLATPSFDEPVAPAPPATVVSVQAGAPSEAPVALSVVARGETDVRAAVIGPSFGVGVALGRRLELDALWLAQRATGLRVAGTFYFRPETELRPLVRLGVPAFFENGTTTAGVHLAGGVLWQAMSRLGVFADLAVEYYPNPPGDIHATAVLLAFGAQAGVF